MRFLFYYLYVGPHLILLAAVVFFLRRGLHRRYPFFCASMLFQLTYFVIATAVYVHVLSNPVALSYLYQWVVTFGLPIGAILEFGVLYELSDHLLFSRMKSVESLRPLFRWTAAALLLAASVGSALVGRGDFSRVLAVFQALNFSSNLIKIGFLLALILLTRVLDVSWTGLSAGIALGFGISAAADMGASALMAQLGRPGYLTVDFIRMAAFHICVLVWLIYILLPERRLSLSGSDVRISELETHLQELQRMVRR